MNGIHRLRLFVFWIAAACSAMGTIPQGVQAAPATVAEIANYTGADRDAILEAGARKEGEALLYTTGTQIEPILIRFREKYPYLKLNVYRGDSADVVRRITEEYGARRHVADTIVLNAGGLGFMREAGILQPFRTPEETAYPDDAKEPNRHWINAYEAYVSLGFNTKLVPADQAPKTWDDLLDPKWHGKMALSGRSSTFAHWVGNLVLTKGQDFVMRLGKQNLAVYEISGRALSNLIVSGEVALSPEIYDSHMANSARQGASVSWRALGSVYAGAGAAAVANKAPHPHAAMLLLDFFLSKEGQAMRMEIGDASARTDLSTGARPSQILYLEDRPNYAKEFEDWMALGEKAFGPARKK